MKPVSANIATIPNRREMLDKTLRSLYSQVDIINICLNGYDHNPFEGDPKIRTVLSDNSLGDAGKFMFQKDWDGYYFTCDDDIIYPNSYVQDTVCEIDRHGLVTYNGRVFTHFPVKSFYRDKCQKYRYGRSERKTLTVQFGGTGVMAFDTSVFKIPMDVFKRKNMTDVWVGCYARRQGVEIWHIAHKEGYLISQKTPDSIYESQKINDEFQTALVNEVFQSQTS